MNSNEIQVFDDIKERSSEEQGTLLNEWEKLTTFSNRRLTTHNLCTIENFKLHWSVDRITIVGQAKEDILHFFETNDGHLKLVNTRFEQVMNFIESRGGAKSVGINRWNLVDKYGENIAFIEILPYRGKDKDGNDFDKARIDFNPNKLDMALKGQGGLKYFIRKVFKDPHFSRADVACDIINLPDNYVNQYRVNDAVRFNPIYGRDGGLETAYWGARSSERQIRLYNKFLEQRKKGAILPEGVNTWWRWEAQLRRDRASNWLDSVHESLDKFCAPTLVPFDISVSDKVMLTGLMADPNLWSQLHRNTKYKYRKLLKQVAQADELTQHMKSSFSESVRDLERELDNWLTGMSISKEEETTL
ncbi:TPA: replication initiation factor domain-containing protein [Streptococcus equi subsp. zooepidemicus]|nr:replication initiation factor domain-containing protein [Streptococcus equi subsp. zooepidemicus]